MDNIYAVDQIIEDKVVLENIITKEKIIENIDNLPQDIKEGTILEIINNNYIINKELEDKRRLELRIRLNKLKNLNKE